MLTRTDTDEAARFRAVGRSCRHLCGGNGGLIPAFKLTSVANVADLVGGAGSGRGAWLVDFGQRMTAGFMLACQRSGRHRDHCPGVLGGSGLSGDLLALWMTLMMVLIMIIYRRWPGTPVTLPTVAASLLLLPVCWVLGDPASASAGQIALTALFGLTYVVASVTLAGGSACLAPGETALVSVSETPWAILLVGLGLAEWPSTQTAIGGTVIMAAVLWYQVTALRRGA